VIPANIAEEVAHDAAEQDLFETFVTEKVLGGQSIFGLYPPDAANKQAFEAWKAQRK
jgi:regulator of RNase E activity RraA